jgi:hypothetical protein
MKIILNKDEMVEDIPDLMDFIKDSYIYKTNLTQDDIEYLIDKYVR